MELIDLCRVCDVAVTGILPVNKDVLNKFKIKETKWKPNEENVNKFNRIYRLMMTMGLNDTILTESQSISNSPRNLVNNLYSKSVIDTGAEIVLMVIWDNNAFKLSIGATAKQDSVRGRTAFLQFCKMANKYGINMKAYAVTKEEGLKIKETIHKPLIKMFYPNMEIKGNIHHIDFHSSYASHLVKVNPEFYPVVNEFYENRKTNPKNKAILTNAIGYMQSKYCGYAYAQLSADAINGNFNSVLSLGEKLKASGRMILGYNTDGIWYQGTIYTDEDEGPGIKQWSHDYHALRFRAFSNGAYEFETYAAPNDFKIQYNIRLRGICALDSVKPREQWVWGEFKKYGGKVHTWEFDPARGLVEGDLDETYD